MILDQWSGSLSPKITDLFSDNANDRNRGKFELERDFCGKFSQNCIFWKKFWAKRFTSFFGAHFGQNETFGVSFGQK